ncbi:Protein ANTAGONIST OF LIKE HETEROCHROMATIN PROTEIN 1 [Frankliniella fusca]|uniref:Protein ANTAGONIST OF LIKE HETEROCHROMATIN PROTEIN 1 n=1 Tax=Frankliniella fusca TaxID=407009 RepID=A0AAE1LSL6_9NEOP|nr:Protein ANTAGONIST OF LIKE HETEROCHROMATIN PROTEIN 1 [Frankliniella fusca]
MDDEDALVVAAVVAAAALLDGNDEDNRGRRNKKRPVADVDVNGYRVLDDISFKEHFRMNRILFERLLVILGNHMVRVGTVQRLRKALDLALMMSLWILATQDTFRSVAVKFNESSPSSVHSQYKRIIKALRQVAPLFIQWPNQFERDNIKADFERRYSYPGVVGCIDGTHIYITAPTIQSQRYINRFKKYSILLQAVCDNEGVFRDIFVGQPGSIHDSRMYKRSPLSQNLLHNAEMLSPGEHILGDGAYTLTDKLVTPYRDMGRLSRRQRKHNYLHAKTRSIIERSFGYDKGLWRRQKLMQVYNHLYLVDSVIASCVLSNFIKLKGQPYKDPEGDYILLQPQLNEEEEHNIPDEEGDIDDPGNPEFGPNNLADVIPDDQDPVFVRAKVAGRDKRNFIAFTLYPYDD